MDYRILKGEKMMDKCVLLDLERTIISGLTHYWKPNRNGYTTLLNQAGRYSKEEGEKIAEEDVDKRTIVIPQSVIDNILNRN